jgi:Uri superfamily endonuclease
MELDRPRTFAVVGGHFRDVHLPAGHYVYVGSAFGAGGVRARVGHHLGYSVRPLWNVDYVRRAMFIREVWCTYDVVPREHAWAKAIFYDSLDGAVIVPKFGAWDCVKWGPARRCPTHFLHYVRPPSWRAFRAAVRSTIPRHADVHRLQVLPPSATTRSLLRYCEAALRRHGCDFPTDETADGLYARFVECFGVDTGWPVIGTRSRQGRNVFVYRGRVGDVWTLVGHTVNRARDWVAGPLETLVLPGTDEVKALVRLARSDGIELIEG